MSNLRVSALAFALFGAALSVNGQVAGRVTGSVVDATGAGVPNASVSLQLPGTGSNVYTTATSATGDFTIPTVNPGTYDLAVESKGFLKSLVKGLTVETNRATDVPQIKLELATVSQSVDVTEARTTVETSNVEVATTIAKSQIANLPVLDRSPLGFVQTQAGINNARGTTTVNGQRSSYVNVTLDGINVQDNYIRTNDVDFLPNLLLLDQVAEMTIVSSNASAANPGGSAQIQFITPSGTNDFHGNAYWSNRNNYFAANTWFNNQSGIARPFLNQNQMGGSLGGRIIRNKVFFYTNYEAFRLKQQTPQNHTVLTPDARNGIFTYTVNGAPQKVNILQAMGVQIDPKVAALLQKLPTTINNYNVGDSTASLLRNTAGDTFNKRNNRTRDNATFKGDYLLSTQNAFTVTYAQNRDILDRPDQDGTFTLVPLVANNDTTKLLSFAWRWSPRATLTNEFRFGFNWAPAIFLDSQTIPQYFVGIAPVTGTTAQFTNPDGAVLRTQGRNTDTYNYADNAHWIHGAHTLAFGFQSSLQRIETYNDAGITPTYTLGIGTGNTGLATSQLPGASSSDLAAANALLANLAGYYTSVAQTFNVSSRTSGYVNNYTSLRHDILNNYAAYVEDNWKVSRRFTATLGVRWDYYSPVDERDALQLLPILENNNVIKTILDPNAVLDFAGSAVGRPWYNSNKRHFAPNVGLAWDPTGEGKWVVRGGYSFAYVNDSLIRAAENAATTNAGLSSAVSRSGLTGTLSGGVPAVPTPAYKVPRTFADNYALSPTNAEAMLDPGLVTPYVQQWNVDVQRSYKNWILDLRYVGNHASKAMRGFDYNQVNISQIFPDFVKALNNGLLAQRSAPNAPFDPRYNPNIPGSQPLPFFAQLPSGGLLTNSTVVSDIQTGQVGELASLYQSNGLNGPFNFFANPNELGGNVTTNFSNARYNGLQFEATHRFSNGFQFQGNYVFSKVMSDAAGNQQTDFEPFLDINNTKIEKSRVAGSDITHVIKANGVYQLPFGPGKHFNPSNKVLSKIVGGWNISSILTWQSGTPFSVLSGRGTLNRAARSGNNTASTSLDKSGLDQTFQLVMTGNGPYFVQQSVKGSDGRAVAPDGAAPFTGQVFFQPAAGTLGGLQRNYFSGPWAFNIDAAVYKETRIKERHIIELRMESLNALNHPTWYVGDQTITSTNFGKITSNYFFGDGNDRRLVQFTLRYRF